MNLRVLGCGGAAAAVFILVGVISIWRAGAPAECPGLLPYEPATYEPVGTPMAEPILEGVGELENAGSVTFGFASWTAYVPPGMVPASSGGSLLPPRIVLDCRDGTFQAFQRDTP